MRIRNVLVLAAVLIIAGCKASGESDLERLLNNGGGDPPPGNCENDKTGARQKDEAATFGFYIDNVYPIMQSDCMDCHVAGGDASATAFVLTGIADTDYALIASQTERKVGVHPYLLAKASALAGHTGGQRFALSSAEGNVLTEFAALLDGVDAPQPPGDGCSGLPGDGPFFEGITLASNEETLGKASMLMLGRRPTGAEIDAVSGDSIAALQSTLRNMMTGADFTRFLMIAANDQLLTNKFISEGAPLVDPSSTAAYTRFSPVNYPGLLPDVHHSVDFLYNEALATEPLALVAYVINNERNYREILTAPYTVFNSLSYGFLDHQRSGYVIFKDPDSGAPLSAPAGPDDWVPGVFADGIGTGYFTSVNGGSTTAPKVRIPYPHSGVITTLPWLARWQSTETNRNRKRAKMALRQFLGYDIELTASRPMNADALNDPNNPTYNNTACTSCHYQLDAFAGTFQNWGFTGRFRSNHEFYDAGREYLRRDALNDGYKNSTEMNCGKPLGTGGYCDDDLWYADTFPAGFVFQGDTDITVMPNDNAGRNGAHDNASLRWAMEQLVADPRFATGAARFWYEAVFNEKPLTVPVEGDPEFDGKFAAYVAQQELFDDVAAVFARDNGHGAYNAKDLLVSLFSSPWFRASTAENADARAVELANVGTGALLTPEQLERKVRSVLGIDWRIPDQYSAVRQALTYTFNVMYGGIDSDTVINRTRQVNPLMISVVKRMVSEISCEAVYQDFILETDRESYDDPMVLRPASQRILFVGYAGETPEDVTAIKQLLAKLHRDLWNEQVDVGSAEVQHSFDLFEEFWNYEQDSAETLRCVSNPRSNRVVVPVENNVPVLPPESLRVWRDMLAYFILDYKFLHE